MRTYFFEASPEEREHIATSPGGEAAEYSPEALVSPSQLPSDREGIDILSVFVYSRVTRQVIEALPSLRLIVTRSTGFNHIDLVAAAEKGVAVCNVPAYGENTIAEHAFALLLALSHRIIPAAQSVREGRFDPTPFRGFDLKGKTLGVIGTGHIGRHALGIGRGFGMRLLAYDSYPNQVAAEGLGFKYVALDDLLAQADVISLHLPLLPETRHLIGEESIRKMRKGTILINTGRGELVDTEALAEGLESGQIGGAGLDVLEHEDELAGGEFPAAVKWMLERDSVIITPHSAFNTVEAMRRILETTMENIRLFEAGEPQNLVSVE